ncbi:ferrous iron transport protein A [Lysobacter ruishenii]|uniref:Ferrous iron transport protein A n=1 Tax=Aerolutibacter ruishenii TaxID=686800 RepID=A0A562LWF5_9GAMM|nr:ferrous iron transport protein A [Lysobacter ruishenii]
MKLSELPRRTIATVASVDDQVVNDPIARRLRELGFVPGEQVEIMAVGPIAAEPMLVQVGFTRFALRRSEAARITVCAGTGAEPVPAPSPAVTRAAAPNAQPEPADVASVATGESLATRPDIVAGQDTAIALDPQARASA